jgi:DNA repair protein RadC
MPVSSKRKRIKDLPLALRPREKLVTQGRENLTNAELLAILFGTGTVKKNAIALSETLLQKYPLQRLLHLPLADLVKVSGVGTSKATRVVAALELGERVFGQQALAKTMVQTTKEAVSLLKEYVDKQQEYLVALYLNARNELILKEVIGMGTLSSLRIEPREVLRPAFSTPCASVIVAHNHPSGDPHPSDDDIRFTKRLFDAGEIMGISLLDHVILTKNKYFSFREFKVEE